MCRSSQKRRWYAISTMRVVRPSTGASACSSQRNRLTTTPGTHRTNLTDSTADLISHVIQDRKEKVVEADRRLAEAQARQRQAEIKYERSKERYEFEKAKAIARESRPIIVITR